MKYSKVRTRLLIKLCLDNKVNSNKLSEANGMTPSTAYRILTGETKNPSDESMLLIENYLKSNFPHLFDENGNLILEKSSALEVNPAYQEVSLLLEEVKNGTIDETNVQKLLALISSIIQESHDFEQENLTLLKENNKLRSACQKFYNDVMSKF